MDYGKLKKDELISLCNERSIPHTSSWEKTKIEEILIENDLVNQKKQKQQSQNDIGRTGAIISVVLCSSTTFFWIMLSIIIIGIPFLLLNLAAIITNILYIEGKVNKYVAGIFGIFFAGIVGGSLVLAGKRNQLETIEK